MSIEVVDLRIKVRTTIKIVGHYEPKVVFFGRTLPKAVRDGNLQFALIKRVLVIIFYDNSQVSDPSSEPQMLVLL